MSAFAAGVRTLFNDPNLGVDGFYTPAGGVRGAVRVLRTNTTDRVSGSIAQFGAQAEQDAAELQVSQVLLRPLPGSVLEYEGRTRVIDAPAAPARNGLTWRCLLRAG